MAAVPDQANFDFGGAPIPDNFLGETIERATTEHRRAESQIASIKNDFTGIVDANVAGDFAQNIGGFLRGDFGDAADKSFEDDDTDAKKDIDLSQGLDEMLIDTIHGHSRKESRAEHLKGKLQELYGDNDTTPGGDTAGNIDLGAIADNMANFLGGAEGPAIALQSALPDKKARGSTDLSSLHKEIDALRHKVSQLETSNRSLRTEVQTLQTSKTSLAVNSGKCIDELRGMLIQYQQHLPL